jgi:hypothetical protein
MRQWISTFSVVIVLGLIAACTPTTPNNGATPSNAPSAQPSGASPAPTNSANPNTPATHTPTPPPATTTPSAASGWALFSGSVPCADKATMWWDDDNTAFWGCGKSGTNGFQTTKDGGMTWTQQVKFGGLKIQGITRAPNKTLYVSGIIGSGPVGTINETNPERLDYTELYESGNNAFTSVGQGEGVAVTSDGQVLVDSLTGTNAVYHPGNNAKGKDWFTKTCTGEDRSNFNPDSTKTWCELHGLGEETLADPSAEAYQVTGVQAMNDRFYATGRRINEPAKMRMPSKLPDATYQFQTVQLQKSSEDGEMMDLYVWPSGRIITVGTDQTSGAYLPLIYLCDAGKDCYTASNWQDIELDLHGFKYDKSARDGRAVDASGDTIVVVGNFVPNTGGWAVMSKDGGKTWTDLTASLAALTKNKKLDLLYDVKVFPSGKIMLFGEENFVYTP